MRRAGVCGVCAVFLLLLPSTDARIPQRAGGRLGAGLSGRLQGAGLHGSVQPRGIEDLSWWPKDARRGPRTTREASLSNARARRLAAVEIPIDASPEREDILIFLAMYAMCLGGLSAWISVQEELVEWAS